MSNILVVGASGFLGSYVAKALTNIPSFKNIYAGVREHSNLTRFNILNEASSNEKVNIDVTRRSDLNFTFKKLQPHIVINCSAYGVNYDERNLSEALDINIKGSAMLMELCHKHKVKKYINIGTSFEYGDNPNGIGSNSHLNPNGFYGVVKASQSLLVKNLSDKYKLCTLNVKPFTMFGPLENSYKLFPLIWRSAVESKPIKLTGGKQVRDFLHISDVANFIAKETTKECGLLYKEILIGSTKSRTIKDFCSLIAELSGTPLELLLWDKKKYREDEIFCNYSIKEDVHCLERSLEDSIKMTIEYYNRIAK